MNRKSYLQQLTEQAFSWIVTSPCCWVSFESWLRFFNPLENAKIHMLSQMHISCSGDCVCVEGCIYCSPQGYAYTYACIHVWCVFSPQVQWSVCISQYLLWPSGGRKLIWALQFGQVKAEHWPSSGGLITALRWEAPPTLNIAPNPISCPAVSSFPEVLVLMLTMNLVTYDINNLKYVCILLNCVFPEDPVRLPDNIYLSCWLHSLQHALIMQYVKGCMYIFHIQQRI